MRYNWISNSDILISRWDPRWLLIAPSMHSLYLPFGSRSASLGYKESHVTDLWPMEYERKWCRHILDPTLLKYFVVLHCFYIFHWAGMETWWWRTTFSQRNDSKALRMTEPLDHRNLGSWWSCGTKLPAFLTD